MSVLSPLSLFSRGGSHTVRAANRPRHQLRPEDPRDLNFSVDEDAFPSNFFRAEVRVREPGNLIFASDQQLKQLGASKSWYDDGTFALVKQPFQQLLTINAFVHSLEYANQVPLAIVVMSGCSKSDNKKVSTYVV